MSTSYSLLATMASCMLLAWLLLKEMKFVAMFACFGERVDIHLIRLTGFN